MFVVVSIQLVKRHLPGSKNMYSVCEHLFVTGHKPPELSVSLVYTLYVIAFCYLSNRTSWHCVFTCKMKEVSGYDAHVCGHYWGKCPNTVEWPFIGKYTVTTEDKNFEYIIICHDGVSTVLFLTVMVTSDMFSKINHSSHPFLPPHLAHPIVKQRSHTSCVYKVFLSKHW